MLYLRKIVVTAAAVGMAFAAGVASALTVDGPKVNWKLSTWGPPRAQTAGIERDAELVKERTIGNFTIDIGFAEQFAPAREIISRTSWDALPQQYRDLLLELKDEHYGVLKAAFQEADEKNLPMFRERGLIELVYTPEERQELIDKAARPIWDKWIAEMDGKNIPGQELLDLILATAEKK
ncbi:MAG: hypothetical protein ACK4QW_16470 [Alphaproteobacteria bacterium]